MFIGKMDLSLQCIEATTHCLNFRYMMTFILPSPSCILVLNVELRASIKYIL